jgi:hypothetical protein
MTVKPRPPLDGYLPPWLLQLLGVVVLVGSVVFWAITGRESVLFVSGALSLIGLGAYRAAVDSAKRKFEDHEDE